MAKDSITFKAVASVLLAIAGFFAVLLVNKIFASADEIENVSRRTSVLETQYVAIDKRLDKIDTKQDDMGKDVKELLKR